MRIVIDSNIICSDFHLAGTMFRVFFDGLARMGDSLYVPQLVLDEVKNRYSEKLEGCRYAIDSELHEVRRLTGKPFSSPVPEDTAQAIIEEYGQTLEDRLHKAGAFIVEYPGVAHQAIVQRALSRMKPFTESGVGYRDTLIWETVISIAESDSEPIAFITEDSDFADHEALLHPDLIEDLEERGLDPDRIVLYEDLESFVIDRITPTMEVAEDVLAKLTAGTYAGIDVREAILERIHDLIDWIDLAPVEIGFPPEFENPSLSLVEDTYNIEVTDVRRLTSGELMLEVEADADCEFDFCVLKAAFYDMSREEAPSVWDYDWNRQYVATSESTRIHVVLYLTFDPGTGEVTSMELTSATDIWNIPLKSD